MGGDSLIDFQRINPQTNFVLNFIGAENFVKTSQTILMSHAKIMMVVADLCIRSYSNVRKSKRLHMFIMFIICLTIHV